MDPITGGLISGGMSLLGGLFSSSQNNSNALAMQQQAQAYNTQMSSTAYQRASSDMKAAGLNPAMMFSSGSAASSPTTMPAQLTSAASSIGPAVDKAISTAVSMKTMDKMTDEMALLRSEDLKKKAEVKTEYMRPGLLAADIGKIEAETRNKRAELPTIIDEALSAENRSEMNPTVRKILDQAGFAGRKASDTLSPIGNLVSSARRALNAMGHGY